MITGKEVVLSGQVRGTLIILLAFLWLLPCLRPDVLLRPQVALALFVVGKVGAWFTSLGLLYTGAPTSSWGVPLCLDPGLWPRVPAAAANIGQHLKVWPLVAAGVGFQRAAPL